MPFINQKRAHWTAMGLGMSMSMALLAEPAAAQGGAKSDEARLGDIVVTAQKRSERLQDTPLSVSALTADVIERRDISDIAALSSAVPNLVVMVNPASATTSSLYIRGIGEGDPVMTVDAPNAIYVDGVVMGRTGQIFDLVDLERIEVLRGPQGTLYGRNTTGGAVSFITKRPADRFGIEQMVTFGTFDLFQSRTRIDTGEWGNSGIRAKISYLHKERDGYINNILASDSNDPGAYNINAFRVAVAYDANGPIRVNYAFDYNNRRGRAIPTQLAGTLPYIQSYLDASPLLGGQAAQISRSRVKNIRIDPDGDQRSIVKGHTLNIEFDISSDTKLRSISGYRKSKGGSIETGNLSGTGGLVGFTVSPAVLVPPHDFIPEGVNPIPLQVFGPNTGGQRQWSQEFNLIGKIHDNVDYVLGAFYFEEKAFDRDDTTLTLILPSPPIPLTPTLSVPAFGVILPTVLDYRHRSKSYALFGQATYQVNDKFGVTTGLRQTWDRKQLEQSEPDIRKAAASYNKLTWAASANYKWTEDVMTYARVATGYKSGGFNARTVGDSFKPESIISYELGLKSEMLDRRVRLNAALFLSKYKDLQVSRFEAGSKGNVTTTENAGRATYKGIELELAARVTNRLTLTGDFGYTDRNYDEFLFRDPVSDNLIDISRQRSFAYSSSTTGNAGIEYVIPVSGVGELGINLDYNYRGRVSNSGDRSSPFYTVLQDGPVGLVDARMTLSKIKLSNVDLSVSLWAKNMTNEDYLLSGIDFGPLGYATVSYAEPRTFGIDIRALF